MNSRDELQLAYEIAFYPPRLHQFWNDIKNNRMKNREQTMRLLDMAMQLHSALPEHGFASLRALKRLANYQADARAFGSVTFLRNIRKHLGLSHSVFTDPVPGYMVRDIGLPAFKRISD